MLLVDIITSLMLSKRIPKLSIVVACSLLGVLILQFYWLANAYQVAAYQFRNKVSSVLLELEDDFASQELQSTGVLQHSQISRGPQERDLLNFLKKGYSTVTFSNEKHRNKTININSNAIHSRTEITLFAKTTEKKLDSLFHLRKIDANYVFLIRNNKAGGNIYYSNKKLLASPRFDHQIKLGLVKPLLLQLSIDNPELQILNRLKWILAATFIMMTLICWAFSYMFKTIFEQNRLAMLKTDFVNNMTHELKTPIATVSLALEAIKKFDVDQHPGRKYEYLDICSQEISKLGLFVEKVLDVAALERQKIRMEFQYFNIPFEIKEVVRQLQLLISQKTAQIDILIMGDIPLIYADPHHFRGVVYNLLDNSLKYCTSRPVISITVNADFSSVNISIRDNGKGIPKSFRKSIFEPFFRVPTGNLHAVKGSGLGLTYVSEIVKAFQGSIQVESNENEFCCFTLTLPFSPQLNNVPLNRKDEKL